MAHTIFIKHIAPSFFSLPVAGEEFKSLSLIRDPANYNLLCKLFTRLSEGQQWISEWKNKGELISQFTKLAQRLTRDTAASISDTHSLRAIAREHLFKLEEDADMIEIRRVIWEHLLYQDRLSIAASVKPYSPMEELVVCYQSAP